MKAIIALTLIAYVAAQSPIQVQVPQGPGVQVQIPRQPNQNQPTWQQPQAPQQPWQPPQQPWQPPQRPNARQTWRDPVQDSRCPALGQDNHDGDALLFPRAGFNNQFIICWGGWGCKF